MRARRATLVGTFGVLAGIAAVAGVAFGPAGGLFGADDPWTETTTVRSAVLGRDMAISAFVPQAVDCERMPLLVLLHGRGGDHRSWMSGVFGNGIGIDAIARRLVREGRIHPLVIVSADIDDSYGVDSAPADDGYDHGRYGTYIRTELVQEIETRFGAGGSPETRSIGGVSMGGYAALDAALRTEGMFGRVGALSPALFVSPPADRRWIYGGGDGRSLFELARAGAADEIEVFLGTGRDDYDWIVDGTNALARVLRDRGGDVTAEVVGGGHDVGTWRPLAESMLLQLFPAGDSGC